MKRLSLYLFLILFTLQTPSLADDISDFQIEGMSIGDSLLDYFSEEEIVSLKNSYNDKGYIYNSKKFYSITFRNHPNLQTYEHLQFILKDKDKSNYTFHKAYKGKSYSKQRYKILAKRRNYYKIDGPDGKKFYHREKLRVTPPPDRKTSVPGPRHHLPLPAPCPRAPAPRARRTAAPACPTSHTMKRSARPPVPRLWSA